MLGLDFVSLLATKSNGFTILKSHLHRQYQHSEADSFLPYFNN
jgi:hypothetical protein